MNTNRKNFIQGVLTGILLCVIGAATWFYGPSLMQKPRQEIPLEKAITWIQNKDIKEVVIKQETLELLDTQGETFVTRLDQSDATRSAILAAAKESGTSIKLEPASSGYGWFVLTQFVPLILLPMFAICTVALAILAYKALFNKRVD